MSPQRGSRPPTDELSPRLKQVLSVIPFEREILSSEVISATGLQIPEVVFQLARLVELGHVYVREERQVDLLVRFYRQLRPEEQRPETKVVYD